MLSRLRSRKMRWEKPWDGFGEPFNGQAVRRRTFDFLVEKFNPGVIVETGTFLGFTTRCLAGYGLPTYTVEVSPRVRTAAASALADLENVTLIWGDSAEAVGKLAEEPGLDRPLAYLDAHWEKNVPLNAEVETLLSGSEEALIVIDDFHVPDDPGYGYDIYAGVPLSLDELSLPPEVTVAYPAVAARDETGARRGTAYIGGAQAPAPP